MEINKIIKSRRQELGLTLKEVATALGIAESTVSRYESSDIQNMGIDKIEALSKVLQCSPAYLMGWETTPLAPEDIERSITKDDIAVTLKQLRRNAGYTQKEAAEKLGKKQQTIASWETGQSQPDTNTLFFICSIYGTTVDEAFGFTKNKQRFSPEDIQLVQKYHDLDPHGREMVDFVLDKEHARVTAKVIPLSRPVEPPVTIAAHFEGDEFTEDELDEIREFAESVRNKGK